MLIPSKAYSSIVSMFLGMIVPEHPAIKVAGWVSMMASQSKRESYRVFFSSTLIYSKFSQPIKGL